MKIKISKIKWEQMGRKAGWIKTALGDPKNRYYIETHCDGQEILGSDGTTVVEGRGEISEGMEVQIDKIKRSLKNIRPHWKDANEIVLKVTDYEGNVIAVKDITKEICG